MTNNASRWLDLQRSNKNGEKTDICFQEAFAEIMGSEEKIVTSGSEMQLVSLVVVISLVVMIILVVVISLVVCDEIDEPGKLGSCCLSELADVTCLIVDDNLQC